MSNLLVLGGSGRTGIHVLQEATARGHRVRALVPHPEAVQAPAGVELIKSTPANIDDLRKAAQGTEADQRAEQRPRLGQPLGQARQPRRPTSRPVSPTTTESTRPSAPRTWTGPWPAPSPSATNRPTALRRHSPSLPQ